MRAVSERSHVGGLLATAVPRWSLPLLLLVYETAQRVLAC